MSEAVRGMEMEAGRRPVWAEVDLASLDENYRVLRRHVDPSVRMLAVVKADGYGHGAAAVGRSLIDAGADSLGVAYVEEGIELRSAGIEVSVLVLGSLFPGQEQLVVEHRLTPSIYRLDSLVALSDAAQRSGHVVSYHLKVDTGMGRLGLDLDGLAAFLERARALEWVKLEGVFTQLSSSEEEDSSYTNLQTARFREVLKALESLGVSGQIDHMANSGGTMFHPDCWFDMVRPGIALYGVNPNEGRAARFPLASVMSLKARISFLKRIDAGSPLGYGRSFVTERESVIATLPIGYGDGWNRLLSNQGRVIIGDAFAPIVGRISMDSTLVDVTDLASVGVGDEAILIGKSGGLAITVEEIAEATQTIPYEVLCRIGERIPRVYVRGG